MALLDIDSIRIEFPSRRGTLVAVDGVSLSLEKGEILGVVGESGAGKSTIGNAVIGLLEAPGRLAGGEVLLEGRRIDTLSNAEQRKVRGRRIGMIFQDPLTSARPLQTVESQLGGNHAGAPGPEPRTGAPAPPSNCCARSASTSRNCGPSGIRTNSRAACGNGW